MADTPKSLETTVAVMANDVKYLKDGIDKINATLAALDSRYAGSDKVTALESRISKLESTIDNTKNGVLSWLFSHLGELALTAVVAILVLKDSMS